MGSCKSRVADVYENNETILEVIRNQTIGAKSDYEGPFGRKTMIYCDYTASGRALQFTEDYITEHVLPFYANTHSTSSATARITTRYRANARSIIRKCVNAGVDDEVIFTGAGTTSAIHKVIHSLQLNDPDVASQTIIRIKDTPSGEINYTDLTRLLVDCQSRYSLIIGAFSAASNITGILTDTDAVSAILHSYGALAFWDYATAAPYLPIDMNPRTELSHKDAVYFSPHKFIGGVSTPGVLVAKHAVFRNPVPEGCGGGTVQYVFRTKHGYSQSIPEREEGGTPAIVGSIRAGLALQVKAMVGETNIEERDNYFCRMALRKLRKHPNIVILGNTKARRLPIFSILIKHQSSKKSLHYNFVARLLNDLYGLQVRGGCACAGPYALDLMGISEEDIDEIYGHSARGHRKDGKGGIPWNLIKPGFVRFNLAYFLTEETVKYVLHAVSMVASHGWRLLPLYKPDIKTGEWNHRTFKPKWQQLGEELHVLKSSKPGSKHNRHKEGNISVEISLSVEVKKQSKWNVRTRRFFILGYICDDQGTTVFRTKISLSVEVKKQSKWNVRTRRFFILGYICDDQGTTVFRTKDQVKDTSILYAKESSANRVPGNLEHGRHFVS
ncbi:hypothetical protein CAPTEDRAFT_204913 [Capitella teleta]|uniref:Aminotransferase class V domain-containing protein n=1 Tax=Capitella teleta TaxID=283909 RepID=R7TN41_CAPTE|nr:hypothetical protein CAPTEDRAFT_204913 [Capitella teleta]|eukprot:ELT95059.1 hypothetical protein CAPTEDRAFT_204913 [Capitella teleta]